MTFLDRGVWKVVWVTIIYCTPPVLHRVTSLEYCIQELHSQNFSNTINVSDIIHEQSQSDTPREIRG